MPIVRCFRNQTPLNLFSLSLFPQQLHSPQGAGGRNHVSTMSTHCYRCIIHPQHNKVGVCGLCVRERLVALAEEFSSNRCGEGKRCTSPASAGSASADGPYHSFSSSSAREYCNQLSPPGAPVGESQSGSDQPIHLPPPAATSLLQKLKLKAFISIPASPDRAFFKNGSGIHSPSLATVYQQKSKLHLPFKSRKSSVSELTDGLYTHSKVAPEAGDDQFSAPSTMQSAGHRKTSLMTLFHQNETAPDTINYTALDASEKAIGQTPSEERRRKIEQFSAAMRSPGFAIPSTKAAVLSDYRQTHTAEYLAGTPLRSSAEQSSNSLSSSWIVSLFQRKKRRATSKSKSKAVVSETPPVDVVLEEASARFSVDYASSVSLDSGGITPSIKQIIRSRVQHGEVPHIQMKHEEAKPRYTQGWPAPVDSEHLHAKLEPVPGSTAKIGMHNERYKDAHEAHISEQASHFPRSRSCGQAIWSRTHSSQFFTASPQHHHMGSSKQHVNSKNAKLSSLHHQQHHYITSALDHPTIDAAASKDSRLAFGFYFGPLRHSKRQGGAH